MTIAPGARGIRAVLLDIEGTTTPIAFVRDELFPYARARLAEFLRDAGRSDEVRAAMRLLAAEHRDDRARGDEPPPFPPPVPYLEWLMDRDRKSPGLKRLQGLIWERGYQAGELRGRVFDDVPDAIRAWHGAGLRIAIYSSGSVLAQRRLFESTPAGDLTTCTDAFFDTDVGPKRAASSYTAIARALDLLPAVVLFISDVTAELAAAREAGLPVLLSLRPGNAPQPDAGAFASISSFADVRV